MSHQRNYRPGNNRTNWLLDGLLGRAGFMIDDLPTLTFPPRRKMLVPLTFMQRVKRALGM